jgi:CheY-like chemotaxis protein
MDDQTTSPTAIKKKLILVAEDDAFYAKIYQSKLTAEGFEVALAANGDQALEFIVGRMPDILLLDLIMPEKDGFQTLEELRKNELTKNLKVIVLSNLGQEEDIKKAKAYGVIDYIVKTDISIQDLVKVIKDSLQ